MRVRWRGLELPSRVIRDQQGQKKTRTKYGSVWSSMSPLATTSVVVEGINVAKRHTKPRQSSNTRNMILGVRELIELASSFYTLYPGDVFFTGTPEGVSPIEPGDTITVGESIF